MLAVTITSKLILTCIIILTPFARAQAVQPQPWELKHTRLQQQRDVVFARLETIYSDLLLRIQEEAPSLLTRLSLDPPKPRATGYGLLPEIRDNAQQVSVVPKQTFYSLKWLEGRLQKVLEKANHLADQVYSATGLEPLVASFEQLLKQLRTLESNLTYHKFWQKSVAQHAAYFRKKNILVALAREINTRIINNESPQRVAALRQRLVESVAPFRSTPGLALLNLEGGGKRLPVTVCTDIEDPGFLKDFQMGVQEAFSKSAAARAQQFSVDLRWRLIGKNVLYPDTPPLRGAKIDMKAHRALFPDCLLVLTTGASSTNARVGDHIYLGTGPVSRRTLAHEFGHLLGFEDAYVRGYDGEPDAPYGAVIVEWAGLTDDLMGDSRGGQVSAEMIETLIKAYGSSVK